MNLDESLKRVANRVGINERFLIQKLSGRGAVRNDVLNVRFFCMEKLGFKNFLDTCSFLCIAFVVRIN